MPAAAALPPMHAFMHAARTAQGRFRPTKLQIAPDEAATLEADFGQLLSPALRAAAFNKVPGCGVVVVGVYLDGGRRNTSGGPVAHTLR